MTMRVVGLEDVAKTLTELAPREAQNIMRATLQGVAQQMAKDARKDMPTDSGNMRRGTKAKRERSKPGQVLSTVRVGGPAYYWRFLEYGQGPDNKEYAFFLKRVVAFRSEMESILTEQFGKKLEAALARARKKAGS
jgi:HK97 gp10 family phage protein